MGRVGVWSIHLSQAPIEFVREAAMRLERAGYGSLFAGEGLDTREAFTNAGLLLAATERLVVGTGIANVYARDATAAKVAACTLAEGYPDRFLLGLGVSHEVVVAPRGHTYAKPLSKMRDYLDAMDATSYLSAPEGASETWARDLAAVEQPPTLLAALRPKMLALSGERADGAHPYLTPVAHTAKARAALGEDALLIPELGVILEQDPTEARRRARDHTRWYMQQPNYISNMLDLGFQEADLIDGGSDDLIDDLIAWGDPQRIGGRVTEHLEAGADHVLIQPLNPDYEAAVEELERLAPHVIFGSEPE